MNLSLRLLRSVISSRSFILAAVLIVGALAGAPVHAQQQIIGAPLNPVYGSSGSPVTFSAYPLGGTSVTITQFQWDFGDGQTGFGQTTAHIYGAPGMYPVTLTALGPSGSVASTSTTAYISQGPLSAANVSPGSLSVNNVVPGSSSVPSSLGYVGANAGGPYTGVVGTPILFTGSTSNASAPQFVWDFGDNQGGSGPTVTHTYLAPGTFPVRLSVTDLVTGFTGTATATATVSPGVIAGAGLPSTSPVTPAPSRAGPAVSYPAGWNLVAGPAGTPFPQALSPIYTWQPGDTSYELLPSNTGVAAGAGYWAYFPQPATVLLSGAGSESVTVTLPPGQMVLVGNPSATQAVVIHGADSVLAWDATGQQYRAVQALAPGAGAWISVASGGAVTLSP